MPIPSSHPDESNLVNPTSPHESNNDNTTDNQETTSPRTELLSDSPHPADISWQIADDSHRRSSRQEQPHRRRRDRDVATRTSNSQRELVRLLLEQKTEASTLRTALTTAFQRLELESQRVLNLERANHETAERFRLLNENRLNAQQEASRASEELKLYQYQLETAQREITRAQEAVRAIERQRDEAEAAAERAKAKARRLQQKRLVDAAREEGRRFGFDDGFRHAQEEHQLTLNQRNAQSNNGRRASPSRTQDPDRSYMTGDDGPYQRTPENMVDDDGTSSTSNSPSQLPLNTLQIPSPHQMEPPSLPTSVAPPTHPPLNATSNRQQRPRIQSLQPIEPALRSSLGTVNHLRETAPLKLPVEPKSKSSRVRPDLDIRQARRETREYSERTPTAAVSQPNPSSSRNASAYSPSIQVYQVDMPPPGSRELHYDPNPRISSKKSKSRPQWVTAQQYHELTAQEPLKPPPKPLATGIGPQVDGHYQAADPGPQSGPPNMQPYPPFAHTTGPIPFQPPQPTMVYPGMYSTAPPHKAPRKGVKFAGSLISKSSLAKTKEQASSWYRRFSLRKKNKPVIDPYEENEVPPARTSVESEKLYQVQPKAPSSWYQSRNDKSRSVHSRDYAFEGLRPIPTDAESTSTRMSQFDLIATPGFEESMSMPSEFYAGTSASGRSGKSGKSGGKRLKEKDSSLSVINENPMSRGNTPLKDQFGLRDMVTLNAPSGSGGSFTSSVPQPHFTNGEARGNLFTESYQQPGNSMLMTSNASQEWGAERPPLVADSGRKFSAASVGISVVPPSQTPSDSQQGITPTPRHAYLSPNRAPQPLLPTDPSGFQYHNPPRNRSTSSINAPTSGPYPAPSSPLNQSGNRHFPSMEPAFVGGSPRGSTRRSLKSSGDHYPSFTNSFPTHPTVPGHGSTTSLSRVANHRRSVTHPDSERSYTMRDQPSSHAGATPGPTHNRLSPAQGNRPMRHATSSTSMRSAGSFAKYDPSSYLDPAYWPSDGPNPAGYPPVQSAVSMGKMRARSRTSSISSGLSYQ